jgi:very-short-patch-repair endonuclease
MNGFKFRRQHPFGDYILDFVCLEARLVIELDGGQHAERNAKDGFRTSLLERAGFRVLRFWNHEVLQEMEVVKESIWRALPTPRPSHPSP